MKNKKQLIVILCILLLCTNCANQSTNDTLFNKVKIGTLVTTTTQDGTYIAGYDENLQKLYNKKWKYGQVGSCGFYSPHVVNGIDYEIALGFGYDKDFGTVLGIDAIKNKITEYHFDRTNLTNLYVNTKYIYVISNINYATYLDRYCFKDKKIDSIKIKGIMVLDFAVSEQEDIYFFDDDADNNLYSINFKDKKLKKRIDFTNVINGNIGFLHISNHKLYATYSSNLLVIDLLNYKYSNIELQCDYAGHIVQDGQYLYISDSDPVDSHRNEGGIIKFDTVNQKVVKNWKVDHGIFQIAVAGEYIYILDGANLKIHQYQCNGHNLVLKREISVEEKNKYYYLSGFWVI